MGIPDDVKQKFNGFQANLGVALEVLQQELHVNCAVGEVASITAGISIHVR